MGILSTMRFVQALRFAVSRVVLIVFGILAAIGLLEGLLHLVSLPTLMELNRQQIELWQSDDELVLHLKPNMEARITAHPDFDYTIRTNDLGLRDGPLSERVDIVTIGDSFTFGFGVDEPYIWPTRLEELSAARVANLGWAGWNSYVYPAAIRRYAVPMSARLWIWSFFSNDLIESVGAEEFLTSGKTDYLTEARQSMDPGFPYNLRTFELLMTLLDPKLTQMDEFSYRIFDNGQFRMRLSHGGWEWTDPDSPDVQRGWELTESALAEAQQLAAEQDATWYWSLCRRASMSTGRSSRMRCPAWLSNSLTQRRRGWRRSRQTMESPF